MSNNPASYFYVYCSSGATFEFLEQSLRPYERYNIKTVRITNQDILNKNILEENKDRALALFLPGTSAGQKYRDDLGVKGSKLIKSFAENGGTFFGICAGGYLACEEIKYKGLTSEKEIISDLDFFKATAYGQLDLLDKRFAEPKGWEQSNTTTVSFKTVDKKLRHACVLYWGGARIVPHDGESLDVIAYYDAIKNPDNSQAIAIASKKYGLGSAVFSGVHPEISGELLYDSPTAQRMDARDASYRMELVDKLLQGADEQSMLLYIMVREAFKTERGQQHLKLFKQNGFQGYNIAQNSKIYTLSH